MEFEVFGSKTNLQNQLRMYLTEENVRILYEMKDFLTKVSVTNFTSESHYWLRQKRL
jgi:hypothetical protein